MALVFISFNENMLVSAWKPSSFSFGLFFFYSCAAKRFQFFHLGVFVFKIVSCLFIHVFT